MINIILFRKFLKWVFNKIHFKKQVVKTSENSLSFNSKPSTIISNIYRGILVHGGAGSGKSKTFIYPILEQMISKKFGGIVYDFKSPELINLIHSLNYSIGLNIIEIDFKNLTNSNQINLLDGLTNVAEVKELGSALWKNLNTEAIKKSDFWTTSAENLLTATMYVLIKKHPKYATVSHTLAILLNYNPTELIDFISKDKQAIGLIKSLQSAMELGAEKQVAGTLGTLQNYIAVLNTPEIFWVLSGSSMPTPNDPQNPCIFLLGNDSTLYETYSPIIAMIITATIRKMNKPNMAKSMVVLDELPTIFIPSLETLPATSRSNKIAVIAGVQDISQLVDKYGKDKTDIILSNLGTQFFGRSSLEKTAKYISDLFGQFDKQFTGTSSGKSYGAQMTSSENESKSFQQRSRIKPQDILNYSPGQFSGIIAEGSPREFLNTQFAESHTIEIRKREENKNPMSEYEYEKQFNQIYKDVEVLKLM